VAEHFLDEPAGRHPERVAIAGEPREVTYAGLAALSSRVGSALLAQGVTRGDRVLILLPDSAEFIAAFFGAAKIGAIAVPVNPFARTADYIHYIENSAPRAAIVYSEALEEFLPASSERAQMPIVLVGDEEIETGGVTCAKWRAWTGASSERLAPAETSPHDPAFFLYTSGSGGKPKAAVHRHADMLVTSQGFARGVLDLHKEDVTFSVSKLFFAYGLGNGMYFPLSVGARTVLNPERTKVDRVIEMVTRYRPTVFLPCRRFMQRCCAQRKRNGITWIFLQCGSAFPREKPCRRKFLSAGKKDSGSKFWMESARRKCCTCYFQPSGKMQAGELRFSGAGVRRENCG